MAHGIHGMLGSLLLLCLALCDAGTVHPWPLKNGNPFRTAHSPNTAPRVLSEPTWVFEEPHPKNQRWVIYGSPLIDEQLNVYFAATSGRIYSVDKHGVFRWQHSEEQLWVGDCHLHDKALYCASRGGYAFALEAATGRELWRSRIGPKDCIPTDGFSVVTDGEVMVVPFNADGEFAYLTNNMIAALSIADGREKWRTRLRERPFNIMPSIVNGSVIIADTKGGAHRVNLRTGAYEWHMPSHITATSTTGGGSLSPDGRMFYLTANAAGTRGALVFVFTVYPGIAQYMVACLCMAAALGLAVKGKTKRRRLLTLFLVIEFLLAAAGLWMVPSIPSWDKYSMIRAVHVDNGTLAWERTMPGEMSASPSVATLTPGGPLAVIYGNSLCDYGGLQSMCRNHVHAADAKTGERIWTFQEPGRATALNFFVEGEKEGVNDPTLTCIPDRLTNSAVGADGIVYVNVWKKTWSLRDANGDGVVDPEDPAEASHYDMGYTDGLRTKTVQENAMQGSPGLAPGMLVVASCWKVVAFLA